MADQAIAAQLANVGANGPQTISNFLDLRNKKLQGDAAASNLQVTQAQNQDALTARQIIQDPSMKDEQGQPDPAKIAAAFAQKAPTALATVFPSVVKAHSDRVALQSAVQSLDNDSRGLVGSALGTATNRDELQQNLSLLKEQVPQTGAAADALLRRLPTMPEDPKDPSVFAKFRDHIRDSYINVGQQYAGTAPSTDIIPGAQPGTAQPVNTNARATGGVGPNAAPLRQNVPKQSITDIYGQMFTFNSQTGNYEPAAGHVRPGAQAPGEIGDIAAQVEQGAERIKNIRASANDARTQLDILHRIHDLASSTTTGTGIDKLNKAKTLLGQIPGMEGVAESAQNFNELSKFLAQNAARQGASLGLQGSDARLEAAQKANPNTEMDPKTIQSVAQYQAGLVRMAKAKADALDNWLSKPGNSTRNQAEFEKMWRENADPRLFQLAEIKDQKEATDYASRYVKKGESEALARKHQALVGMGAIE